jgi:phage portal protein BeeE
VQGAGETRIAAAAGVPPVIVGLSEGLAAATYSNYSQVRHRFADSTMHPLWANAAGSLAHLVRASGTAASSAVRLWYDARGVPFLREDRKDAAEILASQAQKIRTLVDAGFTPDSVRRAVDAEDWSLLSHTGLFSVQLQPPGAI